MITTRLEKEFQDSILGRDMLSMAIDWINKNLNPEDVFDEKQLEQWADENGWSK